MNEQTNPLKCNRVVRRVICAAAILGMLIALDGIGASIVGSRIAQAGTGSLDLEEKADWQNQYRMLLNDEVRLKDNAARSRQNYAQAQRRNYPRGGARQKFIQDAEQAEADLVKVKAETEELLEDARRNAIPRNWFYEVDDEAQATPSPASANPDDPTIDREGRNPLYLTD